MFSRHMPTLFSSPCLAWYYICSTVGHGLHINRSIWTRNTLGRRDRRAGNVEPWCHRKPKKAYIKSLVTSATTFFSLRFSGFNLSVGCFGPTLSKIAPNGQIWEFTGSRMDHSSPNYVARLFYVKQIEKNDNLIQQKRKNVDFREKNLWEATCLTPKMEKIIPPISSTQN